MKTNLPPSLALRSRRRSLAFTFTEVMVASAILMMVLAGVLTGHLFGVRLFEITKSKLGASDEARTAISLMIREIRSAKVVKIGNGNLNEFAEVEPDTAQVGSAIQVYASTNTNTFVRYFWDPADQKLKRTIGGTNAMSIVANSVSNNLVFTSEDFKGNLLMNNENNRVIGLRLEFYQIQYPVVPIGPGHYFDYYQLRTKITRRALE